MRLPIIATDIEEAVLKQLHTDISIYNGGVKQFKTGFKEFHDVPSSYALLHNSGTSALYALYFAAGLKPGDEVIFPVYTFHATWSPAMRFGILPCSATLYRMAPSPQLPSRKLWASILKLSSGVICGASRAT